MIFAELQEAFRDDRAIGFAVFGVFFRIAVDGRDEAELRERTQRADLIRNGELVLVKEAELVEIVETITACRDAKDNKFLELAVSGKADCIVSGDDDLLVLNSFRGIKILTLREYLSDSAQ